MTNQTATADTAYPKRPKFFANKFVRLLTKAAVAQELGPEACWLLAVIAHQEDSIRYSRRVTYYNEQLMPLCGFGSKKRLVAARCKAVGGGWLEYQAGGKGVPGTYRVLIPAAYQDVSDGPCDEGDDSVSRSDSERQPERKPERQPHPNRNGKGSPSNPIPNPTPENLSRRTCRFDEEDQAIAEWMFSLIRKLNPEHKQPNLDAWANDIRLMRERDHRTPENIRATFAWANQDGFWQANILSPGKLREQFDQLKLRMNGGSNGQGSNNHRGSPGKDANRPGRVAAPAGKYAHLD